MSSSFKRKLSAFVSMLALVSISSAAMADTATFSANNVLGKTNNAEVAIKGNRMDINVNGRIGAVAQVDMKKFNVAKNQQVNYGFSQRSQTMINRVLGGSESKILGKITNSSIGGGDYANTSKVILINPAGIMFGQGSTVDLNSFTASTFDLKGAKNLKGMTEAQLEAYQTKVLNQMSPSKVTNGKENEIKQMVFDSNYTSELDKGLKGEGVKEGIAKFAGKTKITLNGTHFDKFTDQTNTKVSGFNSNKSVGIVSDNIEYKDSIIRVGDHNNYDLIQDEGSKSYGNIRMVTADGVTFTFFNSGTARGHEITGGTKDINRTINIDNSGLNGKEALTGNYVLVRTMSGSDNKGSDINLKNTVIKGRKLVGRIDNDPMNKNGDVQIVADSGTANVDNVRITTINTINTKTNEGTQDLKGGAVTIRGRHGLNITDSTIKTAGSSREYIVDENGEKLASKAGDVDIWTSQGVANIDNLRVMSSGNITAKAQTKTIGINNSLFRAKNNNGDNPELKNITIKAKNHVNINDTVADAAGNIDISAANSQNALSGYVKITGSQKDGVNQTMLKAGKRIAIESKNSTLDNVSSRYQTIKFYNTNTQGTSNVTVKNDSTFTQYNADGTKTNNIALTTNGNITMDNANLKVGNETYSITADDNTAAAYDHTIKNAVKNANKITITSTEGNINVVNNSNVKVGNDIKFTATKGSYTQDKSYVEAGNNVNITANKDVNIRETSEKSGVRIVGDNTAVKAGNNVTITSKAGNYVQHNANVTAKTNANITAKNNVNISNEYGENTLMSQEVIDAVKAGNDVNITAQSGNYVQDDASIYAGKNVNITAANNLNIKDDHDVKISGRYHYSDTAIQAGKNINLTAQNGNYNQQTATISSGNDTNITATNGSVYIKADSQEHATGNLNIVSKNDINFGKKSTDNIDSTSYFTSGNNMKFQSTAGSITGEKTDMETPHVVIANSPNEPNIRYGNRLEFNAKGDNVFTSKNSLKSVNVDYVAGRSNKFNTQGDIQFVNSSLQGQENVINSGDDIVLNNLKYDNAKTQINAAGYITTENVTGEDLSAKGGSFPQSVSVDLQPSCDPAPEVNPIYGNEDSF